MDPFRFNPRLAELEDRLTPAVTPAEVFAAMKQTREAKVEIAQITEYFSGPVNVYAQSYYATVMPMIVDASVESAVVLNEYFAALQTKITENGPDAAFAQQLSGGTGQHLSWSYANMHLAEARGISLGAAPRHVRFPPPVVTPPVTPPVTPEPPPVIPRDTSGMTTVLPSLAAPEWQDVGNGLRVWDVVEGTGAPVQTGQEITLHYTGWLRDGTIFDTSTDSSEPVTFDLDNLIQGWQQAIPGMRPGGIRRLDIPAELAYGERGSPPSIPPGADLVFEIKMFESRDSSEEA